MLGELAALGAALVISISGTITAHLSQRLGTFTLIAWRALIGSILYLAIFAALGKWSDLLNMPLTSILGFLGDAGVAAIIAGGLFIASLRHIGLSIAMPVSSTYPVFAILIALAVFQEPISWFLLLAMPLIVAGIWLLSSPDSQRRSQGTESTGPPPHHSTARGVALPLAAAIAWAVAANILKVAVRGADLMAGTLIGNSTLTVAAFLLARPGRSMRELRQLGQTSVRLLALSAVFEMALAPLFYFFAVQQAGIARTSVLGSVSPIFALPLAVLFLAEQLTAGKAFGLILCTFGAALAFS